MIQNFTKWLFLSLSLFLVFPVLAQAKTASQIAQANLENEIYSFLQQGKYEQIKNALSKIEVCPKSKEKTKDEIPQRCTLNQFNPDPFKMEDSKEIDRVIDAVYPYDHKYTTPVTLTIVRPVAALKNVLSRQYSDRFGKDISKHDLKALESYVQFQDTYKDSWLENVTTSLLAEQIWKLSPNYTELYSRGMSFYYDVKWHEAQGISMDEAGKLEYAFRDNYIRTKCYSTPFDGEIVYDTTLESFLYNIYQYNLGIAETARNNNDETFPGKYDAIKRKVYYKLFTKFTESDYTSLILVYARKNYFWEAVGIKDIQEDLLQEMQANVAENYPKLCVTELNIVQRSLYRVCSSGLCTDTPIEACKDFIKYAKEYGIWTDETQKKYNQLRRENNFLNRAWRSLEGRLKEIKNSDVDLDNISDFDLPN